MRLALVLVLVVLAGIAHADDKTLKPYAGQVVLSPDPPSANFNELPAFLKANYDKSAHYEFIKWDVNFVGVLAKPADKVTLVVSDDHKTELISIELAASRQVVIGHFKPTKAAGFAAGKTYAVTLVSGKATVAKAELTLRE
ncbi:MAG: hypothetical protein ABI591_22605 [Kofleriaceae bacterium]